MSYLHIIRNYKASIPNRCFCFPVNHAGSRSGCGVALCLLLQPDRISIKALVRGENLYDSLFIDLGGRRLNVTLPRESGKERKEKKRKEKRAVPYDMIPRQSYSTIGRRL
jgi:hypothetical protein